MIEIADDQKLRVFSDNETVERASSAKGQTAEARRTTILQPAEQKSQSQKDRQNEKAEDYVPDE